MTSSSSRYRLESLPAARGVAPGVLLLLALAACGGGATRKADAISVTVPASGTSGQSGYHASVPAQDGASYAWNIDNGSLDTPANTASIRFTAGDLGRPVTLVCTVSGPSGTRQGSAAVPLAPGPVITTAPSVTLWQGVQTATTPARSGLTYTWTAKGGVIVAGQGSPKVEYYPIPPGSTSAGLRAAPRLAGASASSGEFGLTLETIDTITGEREDTSLEVDELEDDAVPAGLEFFPGAAVLAVGQPIDEIYNDSTGGSIGAYSIDPPLPAGLALDPLDGFIHGTPTAAAPAQVYTVTASGRGAFASQGTQATLTLTVVAAGPAVTVTPAVSQDVAYGSPAGFTASATGVGPFKYQWFKVAGGGFQAALTPPLDAPAGLTYAIPSVAAEDAGAYQVVVTDAQGLSTPSSSVTLNVLPVAAIEPASQGVSQGDPATFTASALGVGPFTYQWFKLDAGGNRTALTSVLPDPGGSTYTLASAASGDAGDYQVQVADAAGHLATSAGAALAVNPAAPPALGVSLSSTRTYSALYNQVSMSAAPSGTGPYQFQWFKIDGGGSSSALTGIQGDPAGRTYTIASTSLNDTGLYYVQVSNGSGQAATSNQVALNVLTPPSVTASPGTQSVLAGGQATLSASPIRGDCAYQWFHGTQAISDATSGTCSFNPVSIANAGTYHVQVTDLAGQVADSDDVTLAVTAVPRFAYVGNTADHTLSIYTVDAGTGQLRPHAVQRLGANPVPSLLAIDPASRFLFIADQANNLLQSYSLDPASGTPTAVGMQLALNTTPEAMAVDASGTHLYLACQGTANGSLAMFSIGADGQLASLQSLDTDSLLPPATPPATRPASLAIDPTGQYLVMGDSANATISAFTLASDGTLAAAVSPVSAGNPSPVFAFNPASGLLYAAESVGYCLVCGGEALVHERFSVSSSGLASQGSAEVRVTNTHVPIGIAFDATGQFAYLSMGGSASGSEVDTLPVNSDGTLGQAIHEDLPGGSGSSPMVMDPSTRFGYMVNQGDGTVTVFQGQTDHTFVSLDTLESRQQPFSVALATGNPVHPVPQYAYLPNQTDGTTPISGYSVDAATGALSPLGGMPQATAGDPHPLRLVAAPSGSHVYALNDNDTVSTYAVNQGTLSRIGAPFAPAIPMGLGTVPLAHLALAIDPTGSYLLVLGDCTDTSTGTRTWHLASLYLDPGTGLPEQTAQAAATVAAPANSRNLVVDSQAQFVVVEGAPDPPPSTSASGLLQAYTFDGLTTPGTGALAAAGPVFDFSTQSLVPGVTAAGLGLSPSGALLDVLMKDSLAHPYDSIAECYVFINPGYPGISLANTLLTVSNPAPDPGLVYDPENRFAYVLGAPAGGSAAAPHTLDPSSFLTLETLQTLDPLAHSITVDPSGQRLYQVLAPATGAGSVSLFSIDPATGALTALPGAGTAVTGQGPGTLVFTQTLR